MAILKARPKVSLRAPRIVCIGERFSVEVVLDARRAVEIDGIDVELVARERITVDGSFAKETQLYRLMAQPTACRTIGAGRTDFHASFLIPCGLPPSYQGRFGSTEYLVSVRVRIPRWPDRVELFRLDVTGKAAPKKAKATIFSTRPRGPEAREPYIELSVADRQLTPGAALTGTVALCLGLR